MPNTTLVKFTAGETSPRSRGRFDLAWFTASCEKLLNFIPEIPGPARFRDGFRFVRFTRGGAVARSFRFQLDSSTGYILEFTSGFMRAYKNGDLLTTSRTTITAVTKADPCVITVASDVDLVNDDEIIIGKTTPMVGMEELNGRQVKLANKAGSTYELVDPITGTGIDSTGFTTYASGGDVVEVDEIVSPYLLADLPDISFAPSSGAGVGYIAHKTYAPRKLTVASDVFTLATFARTNDPFLGLDADLGTVVEDFEDNTFAKWTTVGTVELGTVGWDGRTTVPATNLPSRSFISSHSAVVGNFIGNLERAQLVATGTWQIDIGTLMGSLVNGSDTIDTNYMEWRFLMADATNYYRMRIFGPNGNQISLVRAVAGVEVVLATAFLPAPIRSSSSGRAFRISRNSAGEFVFRDNNTIVLAHTDITHSTSTIQQLRVGTSGNTNEVAPTLNSIAWHNISTLEPHQLLCWVDNIFITSNSAEENPLAVAFIESRLGWLGTNARPDSVFLSRAPDDEGNTRYEDYTGGTNADDAVFFALAPVSGQLAFITWGQGTSQGLFVGTFGGPHRVTGSGTDEPIAPGSINAKQLDGFGCEAAAPAGTTRIFWIQRGGTAIRSLRYNLDINDVESYDMLLNAEHIAYSPLQRVVLQVGRPDILWVIRDDGVLAGVSVLGAENVAGWHRQKIGGTSAKVLDAQVLSRTDKDDQLWIVAERAINGATVRTMELMADPPEFPDAEDFFGAGANEEADLALYNEVIYRRSEEYIHTDSAGTYDGSDRGAIAGATVTPGQTGIGAGVAFTASAGVFVAGDVGREIWKKPNRATGVGGGKATITAFTNTTTVTCTITVAFDVTTAVPAGDWYFTATTLFNLWHIEGEASVVVVADGKVIADGGLSGDFAAIAVSSGKITGLAAAAVFHAGLPYEGVLKSHNLVLGGQQGPTQTKPRNISHMYIRLLNSLGAKIGTDLYDLDAVDDSLVDATLSDRPKTLVSGVEPVKIRDGSEAEKGKYFFVSQQRPLPCVVQSVDLRHDVTEEA